jgi:hypothetical protein
MKPAVFILLVALHICSTFAYARKASKTITITHHRTLETIMILRAISPDDYFLSRVKPESKGRPLIYKARAYFDAHKDHPAVAETQRLMDEAKDIGGQLFQGVLYAEELPAIAIKEDLADPMWKGKEAVLKNYMQLLGDFYAKANVGAFLKENEGFYSSASKEASKYVNSDVIAAMESYTGKTNKAYFMYLLPMSPHGWGFSATTGKKDEYVQHAIISPVRNIKWDGVSALTEFGFDGEEATEHYRELVVHEYMHSFITNVIMHDSFRSAINKYDSLFTPALDSAMAEQAYAHWWDFVNEYFVRLGHIRVTATYDTAQAREMKELNAKEYKFVLLNEGEELMKQYERNRKKFKTIDEFLPAMVSAFSVYSRADIDKQLRRTE